MSFSAGNTGAGIYKDTWPKEAVIVDVRGVAELNYVRRGQVCTANGVVSSRFSRGVWSTACPRYHSRLAWISRALAAHSTYSSMPCFVRRRKWVRPSHLLQLGTEHSMQLSQSMISCRIAFRWRRRDAIVPPQRRFHTACNRALLQGLLQAFF